MGSRYPEEQALPPDRPDCTRAISAKEQITINHIDFFISALLLQ